MHVHALPHFRAERPVLGGVAELARRVRVWWHASDLDRQLAEGTHPWRSRELSLRAAQLTSRRRRARFAEELESIVAEVRRCRRDVHACVTLQRVEIVSAADELLALAAELRSSARCPTHSAALVSFLLYDARSPFYYCEAPATPANIARAARAGLETWRSDEALRAGRDYGGGGIASTG